jgi:eukaryotic-like serine/threonine-protein kinase
MLVRLGDPGGRLQGEQASMLARVALAGGAPREILDDVAGADWTSDGAAMAVVRNVDGRARLEFPPGKVLYETTGYLEGPRFSPKGDLIAFVEHPIKGDDAGSVAVVDLAGRRRTLAGGFNTLDGFAWSPSGNEIWFTVSEADSPQLRAVSLSGLQRPLTQVPDGLKLFDVDRSGRALVANQLVRMQTSVLPPGTSSERDLSWFDSTAFADLTGDGKTALFNEQNRGGIFIRKTDGSPAIRLGDGGASAFSPDAKWVLAIPDFYGDNPRIVLLPTGPGEPKPLDTGAVKVRSGTWFPDGKRILLAGDEAGHLTRLYIVSAVGGTPKPIPIAEGIEWKYYEISPDGKQIAASRQGRTELVMEDGSTSPIPELQQGDYPAGWSADGRSLYVFRFNPCSIYRFDLATRRRELIRQPSPPDLVGVLGCFGLRLTPDARSYGYRYMRQLSTLYLVEGLR